jgi:hypothetical protein
MNHSNGKEPEPEIVGKEGGNTMAEEWRIPNKEELLTEEVRDLTLELYRRNLEKELELMSQEGVLKPTPPKVEKRLFNKKDQEYAEALLDTQRDLELIAFGEGLLMQFTEASQRAIVALIHRLEQTTKLYSPGSLAQTVSQSLTVHAAKNLSGVHMKGTNLAGQALLKRRFKDQLEL